MAISRPEVCRFNWGHHLAQGAELAFVADGGITPLDYINNERATATNAPTVSLKPYLGDTIHFVHANSDCITWSYGRPTAWTACTLLTIVQFNTITNNLFLNNSKGLGGGCQLETTAGGILDVHIGGQGAVNSTITLVTGVPYAIAASVVSSAGTINFAVKRLDTGTVLTSTTTTALPLGAGNGIFSSGGDTTASGYDCDVAASVITSRGSSLSALVQWVENPWAIFAPSEATMVTSLPAAVMPPGQNQTYPNTPILSQAWNGAYLGHTWGQRLALTVPNVQPKQQRDWPNPTLPKYSKAYLGYTSNNRLALTVPNTMPFSQDDWQNPIIPQPNRTLPSHQATRVFVSADAVPDNQYDWITPRLPKGVHPAYYGHTLQHNLALKVPNVQPFRQRDWQNPIQPRTLAYHQGFVSPPPLTLGVVPEPFSQNDWPNPRVPAPVNLGFTANNVTALTAPSNPFAQYDWLNPRTVASPAYLGFVSTITTTALGPNFPNNMTDWPNPIRPWSHQAYFGFTANLTTLIGPNFPFSQNDWPNPIVPTSRAYQGFTANAAAALGQVPTPFAQDDWPNPRLAQLPAYLGFTSPGLALTAPNTEPFSQNDWPNPIRPWSTAAYQRWQRGLNLALNVANTEPFTQDDWPNPLLRPFSQAYLGTSNNLATLIGPNVPFSQDDWPNPSSRPYTQAYLGFATTQTTTTPPFAPIDWPNPVRPAIPAAGFTQSALALGTFVQAPFTQADWPNPLLRPFAQAYLGFTSPNRLALTVPNVEPFAQDDWPNPILRLPPIHPISASNVALPAAIVFVPHNQADWPNPILPVARAYQGHFVSGLALTVPNTQPTRQRDWPLPIVRTPAVYQGFVFALPPVTAAPFSQNDWPNPRPAQASYQGFAGNATTLIGPNFPRPTIDWPNPIRAYSTAYQWASPSNLALLAPTPFAQADWPNPIVLLQANRGFVAGGVPFVPAPFSQNDWPNPQPYSIRAYQGFVSNRVIPTPAPFAQHDWPNPIRPIALGTVLAPINIRSLIIEAAGAVPFAQHDWPNYRSLRSPIYGFPLHHYNNVAIDKHANKTYYSHLHDPKANQTLLAASLAAIALRVVAPIAPATLLLREVPTASQVLAASLNPFRKG